METSTDYSRPYRPLPVSLFNRAGRIARRLGFSDRLDIGRMIAAARRRTGLSDFGDEWFLEPLEVLVRSINREARLTPLGMRIQRSRIVSALATRLRVERLVRERPEILEADLGKVIVIAGLQRTATTTLHRLIAADPRVRALRSWESLSPVPLPGEGLPREQPPGETARGRRLPDGGGGRGGGPGRSAGGHPSRRIREAKRAARAIGYLAPDFLAIHPIEHDAPEEEIFLLDLSFMSQSPEAMMHVPGYSRWLEGQDHTKGYRYMLTVLKILHRQRPGEWWVLKTPHHMEYLDVLLGVLPGACIVQTHRDPKRSVASFCSMVAHGRGILSDHVDPAEIGAHWLRKTRRMIERSIAVRAAAGAGVFVDVSYRDLVAEPIGELRRVYGAAGIRFSREAEMAARAVSARNVKNRHGRHVYSPAGFGLDDETIDEACALYRREYRIPDEVARAREGGRPSTPRGG